MNKSTENNKKEDNNYLRSVVAHELHKPARRYYQRRHVDIRALDETWQCDLVDMSAYASVNENYKFILTIIDNFSKYAFAVPLKTKSAKDVTAAMKSVFLKGRYPQKHLHVDQGKEFYNSEFKNLMKEYNINMYSTYSTLKASIVERFNRTLKNQMWERFTFQGSYKWLTILPELIRNYNNTKHRTIKMKPKNVTKNNEKDISRKIYHNQNSMFCVTSKLKKKFKIGDKVRISKYKKIFEKGYTPNWTTEIFTITKVLNTIPITYKLADYQDNNVEGCFYQEELSPVRYPDIYLVEKILKKHKNKVLVRWLGFSSEHDTWENESEL